MWYTLKHLIALANPTLAHTLESTFPGGSERVGCAVPPNSRSSQDLVVLEKAGKVLENHALVSQSSTVIWWLKSKGECRVGCIRASGHQEGPSSSVNMAFINLISSGYIPNLNMRTKIKFLPVRSQWISVLWLFPSDTVISNVHCWLLFYCALVTHRCCSLNRNGHL